MSKTTANRWRVTEDGQHELDRPDGGVCVIARRGDGLWNAYEWGADNRLIYRYEGIATWQQARRWAAV